MQAKSVGTLGRNVLTRSGWSEAEEELLKKRLSIAAHDGTPLREVFDAVALETGRKPNSVRNYYYTALRCRIAGREEPALVRRERSSFTPFTETQIRQLLKDVLSRQAQGLSVRSCAMELGGGNRSQMLRFQNKYRSLLKNRRSLVEEVIREMRDVGQPVYNPYGDEDIAEAALPGNRDDLRPWASALLAALEQESGVGLAALMGNLNALYARLTREDMGESLRRRTAAAEERADAYARRLRSLTMAIRDYLTTRDPSLLTGLRVLVAETEGADGKVVN